LGDERQAFLVRPEYRGSIRSHSVRVCKRSSLELLEAKLLDSETKMLFGQARSLVVTIADNAVLARYQQNVNSQVIVLQNV
jgi:hypothetical protein